MLRAMSLALVLLVIASLGFAPAPVYRERRGSTEDELKHLQGRWLLVSRTREGNKITNHVAYAVQINGDRWVLSSKDSKFRNSRTFSLDVKQSPKHIHMRADGETSAECCIYEVEGDTLKYAYPAEKDLRPLDFRGDSPKWSVDVYKREKR